jgi:Family of unknown function (DUF5677)
MEELNELQDATLEAVAAARDSVQALFVAHESTAGPVYATLKRLFAYMSERSQAVSFLLSAGYVWDAEIILRPLYETNARIWFICLAPTEKDREGLVAEFWGEHAALHNRKRAARADAAASVARKNNSAGDESIFALLTDDRLFTFSEANKGARRKIEQKWSFTEIVKFLAENAPDNFDMSAVTGMLHTYGLASHLIHADDAALDLMLDRKMREPDELIILSVAHVSRIFSDQASLWLFSALALAHRFGKRDSLNEKVIEKCGRVYKLVDPISKKFHASQAQFYARYRSD